MITMKSRRLYYINRITQLLLETNTPKMKVDDIASNLGITKKTIYNYFDSKQQMIECVVDTYLKNKIVELKKEARFGSNPISFLIHIGQNIGSTFRDCEQLLEQKGGVIKENPMHEIFLERRKELVELLIQTYNKGIRDGFIELDVDPELASQVYLSGVETIYMQNGLVSANIISRHQISQVLFYMIKGSCTPTGLNVLREKVDIRVMAC